MQVRLNKFLADLGLASRRKADQLISDGQVLLNHKKAQLGDKINPDQDELTVAGKKFQLADKKNYEYWLLNKPYNVISAASDQAGRKTVFDYLKGKTQTRIYPVGRLDYQSEGLLLMTNDGDLAYRLTHPKYEVKKVYKVWVDGIFATSKIERLLGGVRLSEGLTAFDDLEVIEKEGRDIILKVTIHQGRKREIRRVCAKVGWEVKKLVRLELGTLVMDDLTVGNARKLSDTEIASLKKLVNL